MTSDPGPGAAEPSAALSFFLFLELFRQMTKRDANGLNIFGVSSLEINGTVIIPSSRKATALYGGLYNE